MDENNQYGQAMTKPLPYGCIKEQEHVPIIKLSQLSIIKYLMATTNIYLLIYLFIHLFIYLFIYLSRCNDKKNASVIISKVRF